MIEPLSVRQFAERFPFVSGPGEISLSGWATVLQGWRDTRKLKQCKHYKQALVNGRQARVYAPAAVVRLIVTEAQGKNPRPRISFLYENYMDAFCDILEEAKAASAAIAATPLEV